MTAQSIPMIERLVQIDRAWDWRSICSLSSLISIFHFLLQPWLELSFEVHQLDLSTRWWILRTEKCQAKDFSINKSHLFIRASLHRTYSFSLQQPRAHLLVKPSVNRHSNHDRFTITWWGIPDHNSYPDDITFIKKVVRKCQFTLAPTTACMVVNSPQEFCSHLANRIHWLGAHIIWRREITG